MKKLLVYIGGGLFLGFMVLGLAFLWVYREVEDQLPETNYEGASGWGLYLPTDASRITAFIRAGGLQDLELFYRFSVAPSRVESAIIEAAEASQKGRERKYDFQRQPIDSSTFAWPTWAKSTIPWWQPDSIVEGTYYGTKESYGIQIWADRETGLIYVYQSD